MNFSAKAEEQILKIGIQDTLANVKPLLELQNFIAEAAAEEHIKITYVPLPLSRSAVLANEGKLDGEMVRSKNILADYPNLIASSRPIGTTTFLMIYSATNKNFTPNRLNGLRALIILNSYTVIEELSKRGIKAQETPSIGQGLQMVRTGRVDYLILAKPIIQAGKSDGSTYEGEE